MRVEDVKVCVLYIEGTNCEEESYWVFKRLGAKPEKVHLKLLIGMDTYDDEKRDLLDYDIVMIPGGFSSGDYVRAGAILGARVKSSLEKELVEFGKEGRPILGVCNGFQVLVEIGLLPSFNGFMSSVPQAVLATNDSARYECRPSLLKHENKGNCVFTKKLPEGEVIVCPVAHTEGKFTLPRGKESELLKRMEDLDMIVFKYVDPEGEYAGYFWNPNGSLDNIAGICNSEGNVFGMMPHPERIFHGYQHPDWTREGPKEKGDGRVIFESVLEYVTRKF
ncbi:MAG: phosphoribosylformylglycinamidine synthase subunit PurQ [Methanobacteriota archaeon]|nr:MAG: phosphoribosylformylglycinamidine synthase subunit PurQ [Euryarchaeota archaeon]